MTSAPQLAELPGPRPEDEVLEQSSGRARVSVGAHAARLRLGDRRRARLRGREREFTQLVREGVYASFTGFAIIVVIIWEQGHYSSLHALVALVLGVLGIVVAGFMADLAAHLAVHGHQPYGDELKLLTKVAIAGLGTAVAPTLLLVLATQGVIDSQVALLGSVYIYLAIFAGLGWLAVSGSSLPWWKQLAALGSLILIGFAVVGVQALAHSV